MIRLELSIRFVRWGSWHPPEPVDDALSAVIDVEPDDENRIACAVVACGPRLADATQADLERYSVEEVQPRLQRLFEPGGADIDGWQTSSLGHLQMNLMERWLPDF